MKSQLSLSTFSVLALLISILSPISLTQATEAPALVTCVNLQTGTERISRTDKCRYGQEAQANWHKNLSDSSVASSPTAKVIIVCSNKESSPVSYRLIRKKCARHQVTTVYSRSGSIPSQPVIAEAISYRHDSASLRLATDPATNTDAPIAYFTITASRVDTRTASAIESQRVYFWRDLNIVINVLQASTNYAFTVSATTADGTSPVSNSSSSVTTRAYVAPTPTPSSTTSPITYAVGDTGPGGGKIFYVATTPFVCGPTRAITCTYLEAAPDLWNAGATEPHRTWAKATYQLTTVNNASTPETATATAIGWGYRNTRAIILQGNSDTATSAATLADSYNVTVSSVVYDDWYLPSADELNQMCKWQRGFTGDNLTNLSTTCAAGILNSGIGAEGFFSSSYWSSSETTNQGAWRVNFGGAVKTNVLKTNSFYVRPIRAF